MKRRAAACAFTICICVGVDGRIARGGDLDPPLGPIAPTMKTLDQVQPRIPLSDATTPGDSGNRFIITQPGSYYLTGDQTNLEFGTGIKIGSGNVTVDLMGFTLGGAEFSGYGIRTDDVRNNVTVRNGVVSDWGQGGVDLAFNNTDCFGSLIESVHAADNGFIGIRAGNSGIVRNCTAISNGSTGIMVFNRGIVESCTVRLNEGNGIFVRAGGVVRDCVADENTFAGIFTNAGGTVANCSAKDNGTDGIGVESGSTVTGCTTLSNDDDGIFCSIGGTVTNCSSRSNADDGFALGAGATITNCTASDNSGDGIQLVGDATVMFNTCNRNGFNGDGAGIHAVIGGGGNRIDSNNVTDNDRGLDIDTSDNFIVRNCARSNGVEYDIAANNKVGLIVQGIGSPVINGSTGGSGLGTSRPWANFSYD